MIYVLDLHSFNCKFYRNCSNEFIKSKIKNIFLGICPTVVGNMTRRYFVPCDPREREQARVYIQQGSCLQLKSVSEWNHCLFGLKYKIKRL